MLTCYGFCQQDILDAKRLLEWTATLGGCKGHTCLLIADEDCDWITVIELQKIAEQSYDSVSIICDGPHGQGWIAGGNSKFKSAAKWAHEHGEPFYFNEPDAIPLKHGWLDAISKEYDERDEAFMGAMIETNAQGWPPSYFEGNSVYSQDIWELMQTLWKDDVTWPLTLAPILTKFGVNSKLFYHVWGEPNNPPIFSTKNVPATSVFSLKNIPPEAVVFHRNKGGSLIRQLERARGISHPITVVFPVCPSDIKLGINHARWLRQMGKVYKSSPALIVFDASINISELTEFRNQLIHTFPNIDLFKYPVPPQLGWPMAPNWAFQRTASHMANQDNPWLWFEADCVALVPDWLEQIEDEYFDCGRSWMGPIVKGMGHVNGGCVYPPDAALRSRIAMTCTNEAWDYAMKKDMIHDCHDASHIMGHIWTVLNGEAIETGGGETPANVTPEKARKWFKPSWVVAHRIKDASATEILMRGEYVHG